MPINDFEITGAGLYLPDGTKFMDMPNISNISIDATYEMSDKEFYPLSLSGNYGSISGINYIINEKLLNEMDTVNLNNFTFFTSIPYAVQVRTHKKKRINKKWAKRYGYKLKFIEGKAKDVTYNTETCEFEFSYDNETIRQLYKHDAEIFTYMVLSGMGYKWR